MRKFLFGVLATITVLGLALSLAPTTSSLWLLTHQALVPAAGVKILSLPDCPTDLYTVRVGLCYDSLTGRIKMRDATGVKNL